MKGFSFRINPRYKHLYLVAIFLGIMLIAGITVGFMTGKLVNPFSKAGLVCDQACKSGCAYQLKSCKHNKCEVVGYTGNTLNNCIKNCEDKYNKCVDGCCFNPTPKPKYKTIEDLINECKTKGGHWDEEHDACIIPTPKPTSTPQKSGFNCNDEDCCRQDCANDWQCYQSCVKSIPTPKSTSTQPCNASQMGKCDAQCQRQGKQILNCTQLDINHYNCTCTDNKPTSTPKPNTPPSDCKGPYDGCTAVKKGSACPGGTAPNSWCGDNKWLICCPSYGNNSGSTSGGGNGSTSGGSSSSSCTNNYVIPVVNTVFTEANNSCSNNVYTSTYKISFKTNPAVDPNTNKQVSECGGGHFKLTLLFPSFVAGHITSANRGGQIQGNKVVWSSIHIYDNANFGPFVVTINQPKDSTPQQTFQEKIIVQNVDHARPQPAQKALATNVGACYTASSTDSGGSGSTITATPAPTYNNDNNNYYTPPNTGILDEHPILVVAFIAGLAILETTFGLFSKAIINIKKLVD